MTRRAYPSHFRRYSGTTVEQFGAPRLHEHPRIGYTKIKDLRTGHIYHNQSTSRIPYWRKTLITISPATASISQGATQAHTKTVQFNATATVTWSVEGSGNGTINGSGLYTAPAKAGTFTIRATSTEDTSIYGFAFVTVAAVAIGMTPTTATKDQGATQQFTATVTGSVTTTKSFAVTEGGGGSVDSGGLYTAPATAGTYHVVATATADGTKTATSVVTVNAVGITLTESAVTVVNGATHQFSATVTGSVTTTKTWAVTEGGGGTVSGSGLYTAPGTPGTYHVVATASADGTKHATAVVTVT